MKASNSNNWTHIKQEVLEYLYSKIIGAYKSLSPTSRISIDKKSSIKQSIEEIFDKYMSYSKTAKINTPLVYWRENAMYAMVHSRYNFLNYYAPTTRSTVHTFFNRTCAWPIRLITALYETNMPNDVFTIDNLSSYSTRIDTFIDIMDSSIRSIYEDYLVNKMYSTGYIDGADISKVQFHKMYVGKKAHLTSSIYTTDHPELMHQPSYSMVCKISFGYDDNDNNNIVVDTIPKVAVTVYPMIHKIAIFEVDRSSNADELTVLCPLCREYKNGADCVNIIQEYCRNTVFDKVHQYYTEFINSFNSKLSVPYVNPIKESMDTISNLIKNKNDTSILNVVLSLNVASPYNNICVYDIIDRLCILYNDSKGILHSIYYIDSKHRYKKVDNPTDLEEVVKTKLATDSTEVKAVNDDINQINRSALDVANLKKKVVSDSINAIHNILKDPDDLVRRAFKIMFNNFIQSKYKARLINKNGEEDPVIKALMNVIPDIYPTVYGYHNNSILLNLWLMPFLTSDADKDNIEKQLYGERYRYSNTTIVNNKYYNIIYTIKISDNIDLMKRSVRCASDYTVECNVTDLVMHGRYMSIQNFSRFLSSNSTKRCIGELISFIRSFGRYMTTEPALNYFYAIYIYLMKRCKEVTGKDEETIKLLTRKIQRQKCQIQRDHVLDPMNCITLHDSGSLTNFLIQCNYYAYTDYTSFQLV